MSSSLVMQSYHKRKQNWEEVADQVDKTKRELEELERQYLEQLAKSSKNSTLGTRHCHCYCHRYYCCFYCFLY